MCLALMLEESWLGLQHQSLQLGVAQELPRNLGVFQSLVKDSGHNFLSIHPYTHPTAYEGCQTPCMCLALMWEEFWLGLQPQSLQFSIICCPRVTQKSRCLPKAWSTRVAVILLGQIHMHIHSIWRLSNTLNVLGIAVRRILIGSTALITALCYRRYVDKIDSNTIVLLFPISCHWIGTMGRCQVICLL